MSAAQLARLAKLEAVVAALIQPGPAQAPAPWPQMTERYVYEVLSLAEQGGHLDAIGAQTLSWTAAQVAEVLTWWTPPNAPVRGVVQKSPYSSARITV